MHSKASRSVGHQELHLDTSQDSRKVTAAVEGTESELQKEYTVKQQRGTPALFELNNERLAVDSKYVHIITKRSKSSAPKTTSIPFADLLECKRSTGSTLEVCFLAPTTDITR